MPREAVVQFRPLRLRQRRRIRLQAFPHRIQQFNLFGSGEGLDLISQIAHFVYNLSAVFPLWQAPLPILSRQEIDWAFDRIAKVIRKHRTGRTATALVTS
jgi:hypothetical protein